MSGAEAAVRLEVVAGAPTHEEIAAIVAVVLASAGGPPPQRPRRPAWTTAARHEGMGGAPLVSARDARLA